MCKYSLFTNFLYFQELDLVSDFGGCLGLFLGFSVLTAAELVELIFMYFILLVGKFMQIPTLKQGSKVDVKSKRGDEITPASIVYEDNEKSTKYNNMKTRHTSLA